MKSSTTDVLDINDMFHLTSKYKGLLITGTLISMVLFAVAAVFFPQKYKAHFVLAIHSSYFQNPLTRDLMSDTYDSTEMRSQRESLIRQALRPEFIDALGEKYGIYQAGANGPLQRLTLWGREKLGLGESVNKLQSQSEKRQELTARITVMNLNNDTFQISFIYSDPDVAFHVTQDIEAQVMRSLSDVRRNNLLSLHGAIQKRLQSLAASLPSEDATTPANAVAPQPAAYAAPVYTGPGRVEDELAEVRNELRIMSARYTEDHPVVKELRDREATLNALKNSPANGAQFMERPLAVRLPSDAAVDIYKDLTRKLNYLNISFDTGPSADVAILENPEFPTTPLSPKKSLIVLWGLAAGLIASFFIAALHDYFDRSAMHASDLADMLGVPYLGRLPVLSWRP